MASRRKQVASDKPLLNGWCDGAAPRTVDHNEYDRRRPELVQANDSEQLANDPYQRRERLAARASDETSAIRTHAADREGPRPIGDRKLLHSSGCGPEERS